MPIHDTEVPTCCGIQCLYVEKGAHLYILKDWLDSDHYCMQIITLPTDSPLKILLTGNEYTLLHLTKTGKAVYLRQQDVPIRRDDDDDDDDYDDDEERS